MLYSQLFNFRRRWHIRYKFNKKHLVMDLLIVCAVLFLIGLNIFWLWGGFNYFSNDLIMRIEISEREIKSGGSASFEIYYQNGNKFHLDDAVLSFHAPEYFQLEKVSLPSYDYERNVAVLGELAPGANGKIVVSGIIGGNLDEKQFASAGINYYKTNKKGVRLWGRFQDTAVYDYAIAGSYLTIESVLPARLVNNQTFDWTVRLKNTSASITYEKVELKPNWSDRIIALETKQLEAHNFAPGEEISFIIKSRIKTANELENFQIEAYAQNEKFQFLQSRFIKEQKILHPQFLVSQEYIGKKSITPGEWAEIVLKYKNAGGFSLENVELRLELAGDFWDLNNIKKESGSVVDNQIIWTNRDYPKLTLIQPNESGEIALSVKTKETAEASSDLFVKTVPSAKFKVEDVSVELDYDAESIKLNSNLSLRAYPMYYTNGGDQLGRGPLPPRVGEETKYWMFIRAINDISPVNDVLVEAKLPENVEWTGKSNVTVGNALDYNENNRTVSWRISRVPEKAENIGFALELAIVPTFKQLSTYPPLLAGLAISGTDVKTGGKLNKILGEVSIKLPGDKGNSIRNRVGK